MSRPLNSAAWIVGMVLSGCRPTAPSQPIADTSIADTDAPTDTDADTDTASDTGTSVETGPWAVGSLAEAAWQSQRRVGAAISSTAMAKDDVYQQIFSEQFSAWTPEDEAKWGWVQYSDSKTWDFSAADAIAAVGTSADMTMKGHALLWHYSVPGWVGTSPDPEALSAWLATHIETSMQHFDGIATTWDVVNEALADGGGLGAHGLRESLFLTTLGEDYIADAFLAARSADPDARLFYNDYGLIWGEDKTDRAVGLLTDLLQQGVPIDGVGLQCHITASIAPSQQTVQSVLQRFADLGLAVHISELDVQIRDLAGPEDERLFAQALVVWRIVNACAAQPACDLLTFWGFTDRYSWIDTWYGEDDPLLLDEEMNPKPAFYTTIQALQGEVPEGCSEERLGNTDFETDAAGWSAWGSLALDPAAAHGGKQGIRVSDRTGTWMGPTRDVRLEIGEWVPYTVRAAVKLDGASSDVAMVSIKITDDAGTRYQNLAVGAVTDSAWSVLEDTFSLEISGSLQELTLYVEGPAAGVDLLVDDVQVRPACDAPLAVVQATVKQTRD